MLKGQQLAQERSIESNDIDANGKTLADGDAVSNVVNAFVNKDARARRRSSVGTPLMDNLVSDRGHNMSSVDSEISDYKGGVFVDDKVGDEYGEGGISQRAVQESISGRKSGNTAEAGLKRAGVSSLLQDWEIKHADFVDHATNFALGAGHALVFDGQSEYAVPTPKPRSSIRKKDEQLSMPTKDHDHSESVAATPPVPRARYSIQKKDRESVFVAPSRKPDRKDLLSPKESPFVGAEIAENALIDGGVNVGHRGVVSYGVAGGNSGGRGY